MKNITLLGATGSIGKSTLSVVDQHPDQFNIFALSANTNWQAMLELCRQYQPTYAVMTNEEAAEKLQAALNNDTQVFSGEQALCDIAAHQQTDYVMAAIVGAAGMGGIFHTSSINIHEKFRGKGYGKKIQKGLVNEARKRNYSFVTVFVDPRNDSSIKMHDGLDYETIFRIHYSKDVIQDIKIIIFKKRGFIVKKFLRCFNTKIGVFLLAFYFSALPVPIVWLLAILASMLFGAAWAFIPGYLQAYRGSHVVITTIMFNFIASALMVFLLVDVIRDRRQMGPTTEPLINEQWLPMFKDIAAYFGFKVGYSPLNISFLLAILVSFGVWFLIWRTKWGYEMRAVGHNTQAAIYAGISPKKNIILAMVISGALAGMLGVNEVLGVHHKILVNFPAGYGFTGIAVALMGRNHPIGIFLASLLFGMLYQGGSEVTFDMPNITRYMFVAVQGVIILFSGALENLFRPQIEYFFVNTIRRKATT